MFRLYIPWDSWSFWGFARWLHQRVTPPSPVQCPINASYVGNAHRVLTKQRPTYINFPKFFKMLSSQNFWVTPCRPRLRHGEKYNKYKLCLSKMMVICIKQHKLCLSKMMVICIKQHLSNIWSSIHEEVKQHWGWVEKKRCMLINKSVYFTYASAFDDRSSSSSSSASSSSSSACI